MAYRNSRDNLICSCQIRPSGKNLKRRHRNVFVLCACSTQPHAHFAHFCPRFAQLVQSHYASLYSGIKICYLALCRAKGALNGTFCERGEPLGSIPTILDFCIKNMPPRGIEPRTRGFSVPCSTN